YYSRSEKRFRVVLVVAADEAAAKDVLSQLRKQGGAKKQDGVGAEAAVMERRSADDSPVLEWVVGVKGTHVFAVVDEELVLSADQSADEAQKLKLTHDEKVEQLKRILTE